ncbi:MAG: DUF58 domain-containing protein [Syntrophobacteraceae bacterium]
MLISGMFGRKNISGLNVELEFPNEVFAQTDTPVGIKLTNPGKFMPAFLIKILVGEYEVFFPFLRARSSATLHVGMKFNKRGSQTIERIHISSVFPFNFFTRYRKLAGNFDLVVFPKPIKCQLADLYDREAKRKGEIPSNRTGHESDIISIRDYASGDPPKYISWKSTAKTGRLKTKELSSIQSQLVIIDFDKMEKKHIEETISFVTYAIVRLIRSNTPVGLLIDGDLIKAGISPAHKNKMLKKLALYG